MIREKLRLGAGLGVGEAAGRPGVSLGSVMGRGSLGFPGKPVKGAVPASSAGRGVRSADRSAVSSTRDRGPGRRSPATYCHAARNGLPEAILLRR